MDIYTEILEILKIILPLLTLIFGFWQGRLQKERDLDKKRWGEKQKAYMEVNAAIYSLFKNIKSILRNRRCNLEIGPRPGEENMVPVNMPREIMIEMEYDESFNNIGKVSIKNSLYIEPELLDDLLKLEKRINLIENNYQISVYGYDENESTALTNYDNKLEDEWAEAKRIMSIMRKNIGLEVYSDELLEYSSL